MVRFSLATISILAFAVSTPARAQESTMDTLTSVNDADYTVPLTFTGKIDKITLDINRPQLSDEDIQKLEEAVKWRGDKG